MGHLHTIDQILGKHWVDKSRKDRIPTEMRPKAL